MNARAYLETIAGRRIAYHSLPARDDNTALPGVVFLGGFRSDMGGIKATWLESWARAHGRAFLRFDYSGHGASSGDFLDGCIGDWADDAEAALCRLTTGPQVLVGSSMGGWIALLLARRHPGCVAALVGIAAAPDFTEDLRAGLSPEELRALTEEGVVRRPSAYSDEPYAYTRQLIEEGNSHLVLRTPLRLDCPVRLLHGTADPDVPEAVSRRLLHHLDAPDARLTLVRGADHRFSGPRELALIGQVLEELTPIGP